MRNIGIILICLLAFQAKAQETSKIPIINAFDSLVNSSNNYQQYKVIKKVSLNAFKENLATTADSLVSKIETLDNKIETSEAKRENLVQEIQTTNTELEALKAAKDEINFLGLKMVKSSYMIMVWSIILVLLLILVLVFVKYRNRNIVTQELKENLENTNKEFEHYKHRAIEKQQKLGRELLDVQKKVQNKNRKSQ